MSDLEINSEDNGLRQIEEFFETNDFQIGQACR